MASEESKKKLDVLTETNYFHWSKRIQAALRQKRWWESIDPGYDEDEDEWTVQQTQRNADALNYILCRVDDVDLDDIIESTKAKEAWNLLKQIHSSMDIFQIVDVVEELCTCKKTENESMREYIAKVVRLVRDVNSALNLTNPEEESVQFSDAMVAVFILRGLKHIQKYKALIKSHFAKVEELTIKNVKAVLIFEDRQDKLEARKEDVSVYKSTYVNKDTNKTTLYGATVFLHNFPF